MSLDFLFRAAPLANLLLESPTNKGVIQPLSHHELLLLLLELVLLLLAARGLGELMRRISLPPVVGELLAGVVLGPSVFGALLPGLQAQIFPRSQTQANLLSAEAWLGVLFLLIVTGLETDLNLILRKGKTAFVVSLGGIIVPFITGFGLGMALPEDFLVHPSQRLVFSLFIATAMSISAVPVIAKVLMDLRLIRRDIGQVILAAGMTDDTIGWILLSVVSGLVTSGSFNGLTMVRSVMSALLFIGFALTVGQLLVNGAFWWVDEHIGGATASLSMLLILALGSAALTHALGVEAVLGAFVVGILAAQSRRFHREAGHTLEMITAGFLAPIFFASAGLKVNLVQLFNPRTFWVGLVVLAIACFGKFVGAYIGSRVGRLSHWEGLAMGSGMNARGAMEIIVATIGLSLGVLNQQMYSIIVMVAIVTSLMAPPLLRWTLSKVVIGAEEANRLQQEQEDRQSFVHPIRRILIPSRGGSNVQMAAQLVSYLAKRQSLDVTVLYASGDAGSGHGKPSRTTPTPRIEAAFAAVQAVMTGSKGNVQNKVGYGSDRAEVILNEARRGYDLIVMGASEPEGIGGSLFNVLVDRIVQEAPCSTMVVKSHLLKSQGDFCPIPVQPMRNILVPTVGSRASLNAVEMACSIAVQTGATVTLVHVVNRSQAEYILFEQRTMEPVMEIAREIVEYQAQVGRRLGAEVHHQILEGNSPEETIVEFAGHHEVDLIMLGSTIRLVTGRAFFGHRVDAILTKTHCPVAVISSV
jgi:Kef-type K+ transport system membrane component KefB/nucleotide-binding universal stress UspA family protein